MDNTNNTEEKVAELVRGAGKRTPLPEDVRERLENSFRAELTNTQRRHRMSQTSIAGALAASLFISVFLVFQFTGNEQRLEVATVARDKGEVNWRHLEESGPLRRGNTIQLGDVLTTGEGAASLNPSGANIDIRLDRMTEITFIDPTTIQLNRGAVYIDSDPVQKSF